MMSYQNRWHGSCVMGGMLLRLTFFLGILFPSLAFGQFGVNVRYLSAGEATVINQDGIHAGIEYHFRLQNNRIEFHPLLGYRFTSAKTPEFAGHYNSIDFDFNTSIYPFDFEGDCDCPTFSKEGSIFQKGFFIELQPGVGRQTLIYDSYPSANVPKPSNVVLKLGAAVGLDIGLSDRFTVTPYFSMTRLLSGEWEGLEVITDGASAKLDDSFIKGFGLRVTYSEDDKKRRRRN